MFIFILFSTFIFLTESAFIPHDSASNHIVGGRNASICEIPYLVSMQRNGKHFCGGVIVAPTIIVTAAHCCKNREISELSFRAGSSFVNEEGIVVRPKAIHMHPKFDWETLDFDVAVVELVSPLNYTAEIKGALLVDSEPEPNSLVRTSGWGRLWEDGPPPAMLQTVVLSIVDREICSANLKDFDPVTDRMICAGKTAKASCQGDSGGPLTYKGQLAGIVSFGIGCGHKQYPEVYANVAHPEISSFIKNFL